MSLLVLRVGFCVPELVLRQNIAFRNKQIYSPLVFVVVAARSAVVQVADIVRYFRLAYVGTIER